MTYPVSTAKSSSVAGSTLHIAEDTLHTTHTPANAPASAPAQNTHWILYTACHILILNSEHLSLHTENINKQKMLEWHSRFTWQNEP